MVATIQPFSSHRYGQSRPRAPPGGSPFFDAEVGVIRLSSLPTSARCDLRPTRMGYGRVLAECTAPLDTPSTGAAKPTPTRKPTRSPDRRTPKTGTRFWRSAPITPGREDQRERGPGLDADKAGGPDAPEVYEAALAKARDYSDRMHMSRKNIHEELTGKFRESSALRRPSTP